MLNLYKYHTKPEKLDQYENRLTIVPELAYKYAVETNQRFEAGERAIMKDPYYAYLYALNIIEGRWREAEPYIMKDPDYAIQYARDIIKGRWPEAEPYIMNNPYYAYWYARDIIKGRWPEAEPYIMKTNFYWDNYKNRFGIR